MFFGDNIPKNTVEYVNNRLWESDALLAVGSSLQVSNKFIRLKKSLENNFFI